LYTYTVRCTLFVAYRYHSVESIIVGHDVKRYWALNSVSYLARTTMASTLDDKIPPAVKGDAIPLLENKANATPAKLPNQRVPHRRLALTFALVATYLGITYLRRTAPTTAFPDAYMLCSAEGSQIYTVDEEHPTVACMSVRAGEILATGEKSALMLLFSWPTPTDAGDSVQPLLRPFGETLRALPPGRKRRNYLCIMFRLAMRWYPG
jgi:hypothetical protein